jgi:hypothetical protein
LTLRASTPPKRRLADVDRKRDLARRLEPGPGQRRVGEGEERIEIEVGGAELRLEAGRAVGRGPGIGEPAFHVLAVERRFQPVDREFVGRNCDVAARPQGFGLARGNLTAAFQPGHKGFEVGRLDIRRPSEGDALRGRIEPAAHMDLAEARRAEFETVDAPAFVVEAQVSAQRLDGRAAQRDGVDADADLRRDRQPQRAAERVGDGHDRDERRLAQKVRGGKSAVEVELTRGDDAVETRPLAECQLRRGGELERPLVRPVLEFDLLQQRGGGRRPHLARNVPRIAHDPLAARQRGADRPRDTQRALELGNAATDADCAVELGRQRMIGRIDPEPDLDPAVFVEAAAVYPVAVELVAGDEGALPAERPVERPDLAVEPQLLQQDARAGGSMGEDDASVLDVEARDRQCVGAERRRHARPVDPAGRVDAETDLGSDQMQLRCSHLAAQQRAERDFEFERTGAQARLLALLADFDRAQLDARNRQDAGFDRALHAHLQADDVARLFLEYGAVLVPLDDVRRDQRGNQRQNDRNRQSEQRRLHGASVFSVRRALPAVIRACRESLKHGHADCTSRLYRPLGKHGRDDCPRVWPGFPCRRPSPGLAAILCRIARYLVKARRSCPDSRCRADRAPA